MKKTILLIPLLIILFGIQCIKHSDNTTPDNPYGLPNATQIGANVFASRVNGENWITGTKLTQLGAFVSNDTVAVTGSSGDINHYDRLLVRIDGGAVEGKTYMILPGSAVSIMLNTDEDCHGFSSNIPLDTAVSGTIHITKLDRTAKIISGTFACKIPSVSCDTLDISLGRFDIQY
jgi:hypothetical protein